MVLDFRWVRVLYSNLSLHEFCFDDFIFSLTIDFFGLMITFIDSIFMQTYSHLLVSNKLNNFPFSFSCVNQHHSWHQ